MLYSHIWVLYRGEKHPQKSTSVKDGNVRQSSNLTMLETDLDIFFELFIYLLTNQFAET